MTPTERIVQLLEKILETLEDVGNRLPKRTRKVIRKEPPMPRADVRAVIDEYLAVKNIVPADVNLPLYRLYGKYTRDASELLRIAKGDVALVKDQLYRIDKWALEHKLEWTLGTLIKRWLNVRR